MLSALKIDKYGMNNLNMLRNNTNNNVLL